MNRLARINNLGEITWADRTQTRMQDAGLSIPFGFGLGLLFSLVLPATRLNRSVALGVAALNGGLAAISAMLPVDSKIVDTVGQLSGAFAGAALAKAAVGK